MWTGQKMFLERRELSLYKRKLKKMLIERPTTSSILMGLNWKSMVKLDKKRCIDGELYLSKVLVK